MLTKEQIEIRKQGIGSSDIARIVCFDKWQVWAEKTGKSDGVPYTAAMRRGDALEPVIASLYAERLGISEDNIFEGETVVDGHEIATPDYIVYDTSLVEKEHKRILECKAPAYRVGWGEEWTDEIPRHVIIQVQWQMGKVNRSARYCHVSALIGNDHLIYSVNYDRQVFDLLQEIAYDFWHKHVIADIPPLVDESAAATKWLDKRFAKNNGSMLNQTGSTRMLVDALRSRNDSIDRHQKAKDRLTNELKEIIGNADGIEGLCTWKRNKNGKRVFRLLKEDK